MVVFILSKTTFFQYVDNDYIFTACNVCLTVYPSFCLNVLSFSLSTRTSIQRTLKEGEESVQMTSSCFVKRKTLFLVIKLADLNCFVQGGQLHCCLSVNMMKIYLSSWWPVRPLWPVYPSFFINVQLLSLSICTPIQGNEGEDSVRLTSSCFVRRKKNIFSHKSSWFKLFCTRRSTVLPSVCE